MSADSALAKKPKSYVYGDRPIHTHDCADGAHKWQCNSPYCTEINIACPEDGGPVPVIQGYEPWRR